MSVFTSLEKKLDRIFVKKAPPLSSNARRAIVAYLPYINLVLGVLTLLVAWGLYDAAHTVDYLVGSSAAVSRLTFTVWLAIAVLIIEAVIFIAAFPASKARKKPGWDLIFYAFLINVAYGIVILFTDYGGLGRLIGSLAGSAVGFYFLFQIRGNYK
jgi:succinate dehydrogenase/fumarate reductase cytochrome b subunit